MQLQFRQSLIIVNLGPMKEVIVTYPSFMVIAYQIKVLIAPRMRFASLGKQEEEGKKPHSTRKRAFSAKLWADQRP